VILIPRDDLFEAGLDETRVATSQNNRDETTDGSLGRQTTGCAKSVEAIVRKLARRNVAP